MDRYIPRGYVTTALAIERIAEASAPNLMIGKLARDEEIRRLHYLKTQSRRFRTVIPVGPGVMRQSELRQAEIIFTPTDAERLWELGLVTKAERGVSEDVENELRAALAEGDIEAILLTDDGDKIPVAQPHWLGKNGLQTLRLARLRMLVPGALTIFVEGSVLVDESTLKDWTTSFLQSYQGRAAIAPTILEKVRFYSDLNVPWDENVFLDSLPVQSPQGGRDRSQGGQRPASAEKEPAETQEEPHRRFVMPGTSPTLTANNTERQRIAISGETATRSSPGPPQQLSPEFARLPNKPGGGGKQTDKAVERMKGWLNDGMQLDELRRMSDRALIKKAGFSKDTVRKAVDRVLAEFQAKADSAARPKKTDTDQKKPISPT